MLTQHLSSTWQNTLKHLYINPLEICNLNCKICYTKKTKAVLSNLEILDFIHRYQAVQKLESVTFCGGEVFLLRDFPALINELTAQDLFIQIISNGTIDRLAEIKQPNMVNLIISLDGLENYHDQNRGQGNFAKSMCLLKKALELGFHGEVFSIVTRENLASIPEFEKTLTKQLGQRIDITYHPRKPISYLKNHPISNILGQVANFNFLSPDELKFLFKNKSTFPSQNLGCYQIALMSDQKVYACCEGIRPLGNIKTDSKILIENFKNRLSQAKCTAHCCLDCTEPDFVCGFQDIFSKLE